VLFSPWTRLGGYTRIDEVYRKTMRAIDSFAKGDNPGKLTMAGKDLFPLPNAEAA
jgi:hypothetical protein